MNTDDPNHVPSNDGATVDDAPKEYSAGRNWLITLPVAVTLLLAIVFGTSAYIHSQLLNLGGTIWPSYNFLRADMSQPSCDPDMDIDARIEQLKQNSGSTQADSDSLFDTGPVDPEARRRSLEGQRAQCRQHFEMYQYNKEMTGTTSLQAFRAVELGVGKLNEIGNGARSFILVFLVMLGGFVALALNEQIALRVAKSRLDCRVSAGAQVVATLAMAYSAYTWLQIDNGSFWINISWVIGFLMLGAVAIYRTVKVPDDAEPGGSIFHALLTVPLYCWLALVSLSYFFLAEQYIAGPAIQTSIMIRFADLYTAIGLYVWVGMMLKHTRIAELLFDVFHSWELRPEFVVLLVVVAAAWPTAYTGASGIFVLAIGAVIYQELRIAGNNRQLSIASTAMSGSMGVVLNPCLMVVIIAALNRQVTTDQLFGWGIYVFMTSAAMFCLFVYLVRDSKPHVANPRNALPATYRAILPLLPYIAIAAAVIFTYIVLIGQGFNEFSAPTILPLTLLVLLIYDRWRAKRGYQHAMDQADRGKAERPTRKPAGYWNSVRAATAETAVLMGALLSLMVLSVVFGGVMERSGVMEIFPESLGSVWAATAVLVVMLVVIGMIMDPYGAIILVSATLAPIAYSNDINPVHFWMIVLVAFELGYLSPPVALNQLLTRQVVGDAEIQAAKAEVANHPSFFRRHEFLLLPIVTMASSLLLVAFVPLIYMHLF